MKKFITAAVLIFGAILILFVFAGFYNSSAQTLSGGCKVTIKSGWNLMSVAGLACGLLEIDSSGGKTITFPAYLDMYAYTGSEYAHARLTREAVNGNFSRSFEESASRFVSARIQKLTNGRYSDINTYIVDAERNVSEGNAQKSKEYAGTVAREVFMSVWVYNPGKEFSIEHHPEYDEEQFAVSAMNVLATNVSSSEYSKFIDYIENNVVNEVLRDARRQPGYLLFLKNLFSGNIALENGWNFMTYSNVVADDNGSVNFKGGNCDVSKAFVFNNQSKSWVNIDQADKSLIGSGMIVYNSGSTCTVTIGNSIIKTFSNWLKDGSEATPPSLPR